MRRLARDAGTCMSRECSVPIDRYGRIAPHASVIEFRVGSFAARLCDACVQRLIETLQQEIV